jgi:general secretion pathway protein B
MSFILDALKKSESDRQRQSGPALFEVKVAAPRTRLPLWALAIAGLLAVNLAIVMWMLWRHPATRTADTGAGAVPVPAAAPPLPAPAAAAEPHAAGAPTAAPAPASVPLPAPAAQPPAAAPSPVLVANPGATSGGSDNPDDYAPATEAAAAPLLGSRVRRGTADGVPLYQDAAAAPGTRIPPLRLDLLVFAPRSQDRFVMINMHKLREGDSLPEGVRVDRITAEGAVLSFSGSQFLLSRD